jgi:tRNA 2-thiocytidine biosynthesis protein TtcA
LLHERKQWVPIEYEIIAVHVQTDYRCANCVHLTVLKDFFEKNAYKYCFDKIQILKNPDGSTNEINCFWCSWNKRKSLFNLAGRHKCNKVAFGHHKDDIVQTTLLNLFYNSEISTMAPKVKMFEGELDIIRPLAYVEEKEIIKYAKEQDFPSHLCTCPYGQRSQRRYVKDLLFEIEKICPNVKSNIFNSMKRIKKDYLI